MNPARVRTWLFGPGADVRAHRAMAASGADALIQDLEDFTPPPARAQARLLCVDLIPAWRQAGAIACVRINPLEGEGYTDLQSVMAVRPDVIAYPKAATALQMRALDDAIGTLEALHGIATGSTQILPVCETALGVVNVRELAAACDRIRFALLGAEDLAADLMAERSREAAELDHARRRFVLECRAAGIEPIDAPYTFGDVEGAAAEARYVRRLGYRCKSLVRVDHVGAVRGALVPDARELVALRKLVEAFEAARGRGEERALVEGLWVEVPTYLSAKRTLQQAADSPPPA